MRAVHGWLASGWLPAPLRNHSPQTDRSQDTHRKCKGWHSSMWPNSYTLISGANIEIWHSFICKTRVLENIFISNLGSQISQQDYYHRETWEWNRWSVAATQDGRVIVESSEKTWSTGEGNGKPLQYSFLENPMNSMKRQKDRTLKDKLPRSVGAQYATGDQ